MKLIFISGPSGSGKTTLSRHIVRKIKNGIVLSTDNYYKTGIITKILSKLIKGYFDRRISFNYKIFKKDINFILNNGFSINERLYNHEKKTTKNFINKKNNLNFLIVEGIFAREYSRTLNNQMYYYLELKINKNDCMNRVLKRDLTERGKTIKQAKNDFMRSWDIYYDKKNFISLKKNTNEFIITKNTNIDKVLIKIFNLKY